MLARPEVRATSLERTKNIAATSTSPRHPSRKSPFLALVPTQRDELENGEAQEPQASPRRRRPQYNRSMPPRMMGRRRITDWTGRGSRIHTGRGSRGLPDSTGRGSRGSPDFHGTRIRGSPDFHGTRIADHDLHGTRIPRILRRRPAARPARPPRPLPLMQPKSLRVIRVIRVPYEPPDPRDPRNPRPV